MELQRYQEILATLIKPGHEILETLSPRKVSLWHLTSALQGELAELADAMDSANYKEEFGAALFYLHAIALEVQEYEPFWHFHPEADEFVPPDLWSRFFNYTSHPFNLNVHWKSNLVIQAGLLFDIVKKHVIYNKQLDSVQVWAFYQHWGAIRYLILQNAGDPQYCGWSEEELFSANIEKLSKRYPGLQYTDTAAQERKDKDEEIIWPTDGNGEVEFREVESELPNVSSAAADTGDSSYVSSSSSE